MNRVCEILGIEKPIFCGPMAWTSTAPLVAAVSNAGGIGILGVGSGTLEFVEEQIIETKKLTDKPFGINVFLEDRQQLDKITQIIKDTHPPIIYGDILVGLDYELTKYYIDQWHELGCKVIIKPSYIEDTITADKAGADVIVMKGWEAGGHVTFESTMILIPQAVDCTDLPVVAAGGIADGRGMAAAIALGAEAVELGTAFLVAEEADIHPAAKQAVIDCEDMQTVVTGICTGEPSRQIKNALSDQVLAIEAENVKAKAAEMLYPVVQSSLRKGMIDGDLENGAIMAGQISPLLKSIRPAAEIIDSMIAECKEVLKKMPDFEF